MPKYSYHQLLQWVTTNTCKHLWKVRCRSKSRVLFCSESEWALECSEVSEEIATNWNPTRRRMARERRGASSFVVSIKTIYYTTIYWRCFIGRRKEQYQDHILQDNSLHRILRIAFTHRTFYTLHTDAFTQRHFCTQKLLHTRTRALFTHRLLYSQTLLHTEPFTHRTHRSFYTPPTLIHTDAFTHKNVFTHRRFYTRTPLHTKTLLHADAFAHKSFYTQKLLQTDTFTHRRFYTQNLLHTEPFCTKTLLHTDTFTQRSFYTQKLLHTDFLTHRRFYTRTLLITRKRNQWLQVAASGCKWLQVAAGSKWLQVADFLKIKKKRLLRAQWLISMIRNGGKCHSINGLIIANLWQLGMAKSIIVVWRILFEWCCTWNDMK